MDADHLLDLSQQWQQLQDLEVSGQASLQQTVAINKI